MITEAEKRLWRQETFMARLPKTDDLNALRWWNAPRRWYDENDFSSDPVDGIMWRGRRRPRWIGEGPAA